MQYISTKADVHVPYQMFMANLSPFVTNNSSSSFYSTSFHFIVWLHT